jgi:ArpU family phage transcriptional regulator
LQVPESKLPKVTVTYSLVPPQFGSRFYSSTETAAIESVDYEMERDAFLKRVQQAVNRLSFKERQITIERYMRFEEKYDYEIYNELGMSERGYYRVKGRAFYKLAFGLRLKVCEKELLEVK